MAKLKSLSKFQILALALVAIGLVLVLVFGVRTYRSFRMLQYIREQGIDTGTADVDAIQPWMTVRFVAVAYAVPQEYIFAELDIPFDRRNSNDTLGALNRKFNLGRSPDGEFPAIIDPLAEAITQYRENPVATGLEDDVRPWMSIQYISNSTGVPADYIFEQLGIPNEDNNAFKPLDRLDKDYRFGGPREISEAVQAVLARYEAKP